MIKTASIVMTAACAFSLIGCATAQHVDLREPSRLLGRESDVRIDAQMIGSERVSSSSVMTLNYQVQNFRQQPIAFAELVPMTTFDEETGAVTVTLGTEVPGNQLIPRLTMIPSGGKKTFTAGIRMNFIVPNRGQFTAYPSSLRIKLSFLRDVEPFRKLLDIPERAVNDPALAADLFPVWVENQETVITNTIPLQWSGRQEDLNRRPRRF